MSRVQVLRHRIVRPSAGSGDWGADTFATSSGLGAALATDGAIVGIRGTNTSQYGARVTEGNGGSVTFVADGAFDGDDCIRLVPPDTSVGANPAYCSILDGINLTNGGVHEIYQINIAFLARMGSRYIDLAAGSKWLSFGISTAPNGTFANRAAVFEGYFTAGPLTGNPARVYGVTADETQHYFSPYETGCYSAECGPASSYVVVGRTSASHAASPPVIGAGEWVHFEMELDVRQNRGNANGRNKLTVRTADGVINRTLSIALNHEATWNFAWDCVLEMEGLGWYWNLPSTAHADNWIEYSHIRLSANRAVDNPIGPPTGYLD